MGQLIKVAETKDLPPGTAKAVEAEGRTIALFNSGGAYYAIDDACTHRGGPLSEGKVEGTVVSPPAPEGVVSYKVQVDGNEIKVELP
jgi:3-phenylpropionate/trans-cinnamate dioxygenase ferredoxin subunit